jgi:hypothetical protein
MKYTLITIAALLLFFSCKKDGTTTSGSIQSNTTTTLSYTLDAQGRPSGTYSGLFYADSIYYGPQNFGTNEFCYFYNTPQPYAVLGYENYTSTLVNSVIVNNCKFGILNSSYLDTSHTRISLPCKWEVNGNSVIPSFTYTNPTPPPMYSGLGQLPDTANQQQNLILHVNGASGYDMLSISLYDTTTYHNYINYSVSNTVSSIIIPADSLTRFTSVTGVAMFVILTKFNAQSIGGKNFLFATVLSKEKIVNIK